MALAASPPLGLLTDRGLVLEDFVLDVLAVPSVIVKRCHVGVNVA